MGMKTAAKMFFPVLLCVCAASAFAAPWGAAADYTEPKPPNTQTRAVGERYLLNKVLAGQPLRVYLEVNQGAPKRTDFYTQVIRQSYDQWFSYPAQLIRQSGRADEFKDILPLLDKGIKLQFVDAQNADINIYVLPLEAVKAACNLETYGCYARRAQGAPNIFIAEDMLLFKTIGLGRVNTKCTALHEIGHSLGLSDQYEQARSFTSHAVYSTDETSKSIMDENSRLTCDDADGIINLIDISRGRGRGGEFGWRSLCANSDVYYINGAPAGKAPYDITPLEQNRVWQLERYEKGKLVFKATFPLALSGGISPFQPIKGTVTEKDNLGRPLHMRGANGEDIYYAYIYDKYTRLVVKNNTALRAEIKGLAYPKTGKVKKRNVFVVFFGEDDHVSAIEYSKPFKAQGMAGLAVYQKGLEQTNPPVQIGLEFNAKGEVIDRFTYSQEEAAQQDQTSLGRQMRAQIFERRVQELTSWYRRQMAK